MAYSKELEAVIEAALADGVLTDKERAVLHKKAQQEGIDPDELDVVIEGRLAKMKREEDWLRPTPPPATEKRGNIVKCPNCGASIKAGAVKCEECGYVFTNVAANRSAEVLAKAISDILQKHKTAKYEADYEKRDNEIKEYIKNFPVPTSKEDMLEFISSMDAKRKHISEYQTAYSSKYKECVTKARVLFVGDNQIEALIKQTEKFSFSKLTKAHLRIAAIAVAIAVVCVGLFAYNMSDQEIKDRIDAQYELVISQIENLPIPNEENYDECVIALNKITWVKQSSSDNSNSDVSRYEKSRIAPAIGRITQYVELLHAIEPEYIDDQGNKVSERKSYYERKGGYGYKDNKKNPKSYEYNIYDWQERWGYRFL